MDEDIKLEKIGVRKPTYEEIESEYGRMADRCEYAEKINKSLERIIVERDNTIESLTRDIEDYERIVREKNNIVEALTDENKELKVELEKTKKEQNDIMQDCKFKLNSIFGVSGTTLYKNFDSMSVTDVIVARLKDVREIIAVSDHKRWEILYVTGDDICTQRITYNDIERSMFHVSNYGKSWMFVDDLGNKVEVNIDGDVKKKEVKSDDN